MTLFSDSYLCDMCTLTFINVTNKLTTTWNALPSELFQEQLRQTIGRKSPKCPSELVAVIDVMNNSRVHKQS